MKNYKSFQFAFAAAAAMGLSLTACGDDVTEVTEVHKDGMAVLEKGEDLSEQACDTTNVGEMLFVMDSSEAFICDGESWQTLKGEKGETGADGKDGSDGTDGTSCTVKSVKNKDDLNGLEVTCGKTVVDTIWNGAAGKDGKPGNPGKDGENGTNCTAKSVENDAGLKGFELTCGETVVGTIWDGQKGGDGETGKDGANCSLTDDGNGSVAVTCGEGDDAVTTTIYKAVCDTKPYDPKKQFCDTRDNQTYRYVTIAVGDYAETWMAENLNYADSAKTPSLKGKSWCYGEGSLADGEVAENCSKYGRLYTWAAAIDSVALANDKDNSRTCGYDETCELPPVVQGVCPSGWHLPTDAEWENLLAAVGKSSIAGKMLKSQTGWNNKGNGEDAHGFSALSAGYRRSTGSYDLAGNSAFFWSATQDKDDSWYADLMNLNYFSENATMGIESKDYAFSVRCIKD